MVLRKTSPPMWSGTGKLWIALHRLPSGRRLHQPIAEKEPKHATMKELSITPEPVPNKVVHEPATPCISVCMFMECKGMEGSSAHTPAADCELDLASVNYYYEDLEKNIPFNLLSPLEIQVSCVSGGPCVSAEPVTPPWLFNQPAPPVLLPPLAPRTILLTASPGSLVPPALSWSDVFSCASSLHLFGSVVLHLSSSSILVLNPTGFTSDTR